MSHCTAVTNFFRLLTVTLIIGVVLCGLQPLPEQAVWHEQLCTLTIRRRYVRRRRLRRLGLSQVLVLRSRVLFYRWVLVATLLIWSGWTEHQPRVWALLGLPALDFLLAALPLLRPDVLKIRTYGLLTQGVGKFYRLTALVLFCAGLPSSEKHSWAVLAMGSLRTADGAWARGEIEEDGTWRLEMKGHFIFTFQPRDTHEERILQVFLRQIYTPESSPQRPFLRQEWLAEWFDTYQEHISRWQKYARESGLQNLAGDHENWVLTPEIQQAIIDVWYPNFWLSAPQVRECLLAEGHISSPSDISIPSIHRFAKETGFAEVRHQLCEMFSFTADGPEWRDDVLLNRVFEVNEQLMTLLREDAELTPQLTLEMKTLRQGLGVPAPKPKKKLPYAYQLQQFLFGNWESAEGDSLCCPCCGSTLVSYKEDATKTYRDPVTREWREAEGCRGFCHNPECDKDTFTSYPDGVRLYSSWTMDMMIWGVMVYMRMRTTYRLAADAVGVSHATLWRWAMDVGHQALPIATLFGVVRSSGVVGIDEKFVLVPKNNKSAGKMRRWMYVYMAVDVHTYDLLHIDIFPYNGKKEARAFLQALKAKGYRPQVIVTDMNQDYSKPIRSVFPQATHHECVFHALKWAQGLVKDVYGDNYAEDYPKAVLLKEKLYAIFNATSRKTVNKRYREVMALEEEYVAHEPNAHRIFDFLERHYPKLVNAIEHPLTPTTNNTVELVNRRFDQHYQNMCGFNGIETARKYLHLFELTYRFTPFAKDNKPVDGREMDIRGKCPLELAGYNISQMPIARVVRSQLLSLPPKIPRDAVQSV